VPDRTLAHRGLAQKSGLYSLIVPDERVPGPEVHSYPWVAFLTRGVHAPRPAGAFQASKSAILLICASFLAIKKEEDT